MLNAHSIWYIFFRTCLVLGCANHLLKLTQLNPTWLSCVKPKSMFGSSLRLSCVNSFMCLVPNLGLLKNKGRNKVITQSNTTYSGCLFLFSRSTLKPFNCENLMTL